MLIVRTYYVRYQKRQARRLHCTLPACPSLPSLRQQGCRSHLRFSTDLPLPLPLPSIIYPNPNSPRQLDTHHALRSHVYILYTPSCSAWHTLSLSCTSCRRRSHCSSSPPLGLSSGQRPSTCLHPDQALRKETSLRTLPES